uniref:Large ribosomal subunit protein bL35c n=1 Tax=Laurencieae sp. TaxID=2007162 RepID=A0A1Z1M2C6_9FLOR|nr:ribosomal protein L35 [Laurencieae sp.]
MYKLKTVKSVSKRFKISSRGKCLKHNSCRSHLLQKKSAKRKRKLRKVTAVHYYDLCSLGRSLPYI